MRHSKVVTKPVEGSRRNRVEWGPQECPERDVMTSPATRGGPDL